MLRGYEDHREAMVRMACQDGELEFVVQVKMEYNVPGGCLSCCDSEMYIISSFKQEYQIRKYM